MQQQQQQQQQALHAFTPITHAHPTRSTTQQPMASGCCTQRSGRGMNAPDDTVETAGGGTEEHGSSTGGTGGCTAAGGCSPGVQGTDAAGGRGRGHGAGTVATKPAQRSSPKRQGDRTPVTDHQQQQRRPRPASAKALSPAPAPASPAQHPTTSVPAWAPLLQAPPRPIAHPENDDGHPCATGDAPEKAASETACAAWHEVGEPLSAPLPLRHSYTPRPSALSAVSRPHSASAASLGASATRQFNAAAAALSPHSFTASLTRGYVRSGRGGSPRMFDRLQHVSAVSRLFRPLLALPDPVPATSSATTTFHSPESDLLASLLLERTTSLVLYPASKDKVKPRQAGQRKNIVEGERSGRESGGEAELCCICLEALAQGTLVRRLQCNHCMHGHCLKQWLLHRHACVCPLCNQISTKL
ncbi:MAG: hypothetical protein WDW36_007443 [Sanguina aurantia]